jgi:hypothetical protein
MYCDFLLEKYVMEVKVICLNEFIQMAESKTYEKELV